MASHPTPAASADTLKESYRVLVRWCAVAAVVVHSAFIGLFAMYGITIMALLNVLSVAAHLYARWQARPQGNMRHAGNTIGLEVGLHAVAASVTIGWESGFHYLVIPIVPFAMLSTSLGVQGRLAVSAFTSLAYIALLAWCSHHPPLYALPEPVLLAMQYGCIGTLMAVFIACAKRYRNTLFHAQEALAREASTDPLTGALNRRRLTQLSSQHPDNRAGAVLLCDLDHFKQVNDQHGHAAGDTVLQAFYRQLLACTRVGDLVCRWGGEEFLVLLPQSDMAEALPIAQRICNSVAQTPIPISGSVALPITVTIGVTLLGPSETLLAAVQRADAALYRGKAAGRNQWQTEPAGETSAAALA